jgi:hypothetical protein
LVDERHNAAIRECRHRAIGDRPMNRPIGDRQSAMDDEKRTPPR